MTEVCTVFTPRQDDPHWRDDYITMMAAQRHSAKQFGHRHTVMTDRLFDGDKAFDTIRVDLPDELMRALIVGVIKRLERPVLDHICFVDVDCLVDNDLATVFTRGEFDVGLTYRDNELAPINNGVMFVRKEGAARALKFFREALRICGTHWGADQEAISQAAAPVIHAEEQAQRSGAVIRFLSTKFFAAVPRVHLARHTSWVVHFKGDKKEWMLDYARVHHGWAG